MGYIVALPGVAFETSASTQETKRLIDQSDRSDCASLKELMKFCANIQMTQFHYKTRVLNHRHQLSGFRYTIEGFIPTANTIRKKRDIKSGGIVHPASRFFQRTPLNSIEIHRLGL